MYEIQDCHRGGTISLCGDFVASPPRVVFSGENRRRTWRCSATAITPKSSYASPSRPPPPPFPTHHVYCIPPSPSPSRARSQTIFHIKFLELYIIKFLCCVRVSADGIIARNSKTWRTIRLAQFAVLNLFSRIIFQKFVNYSATLPAFPRFQSLTVINVLKTCDIESLVFR